MILIKVDTLKSIFNKRLIDMHIPLSIKMENIVVKPPLI